MAILPIDPITGTGWKSLDASHLVNASQSKLKEGIEELAYLYDEIVVGSRHNVSHYPLLSTYQFGLVQVLETSGQSFTFSEQTSQSIALNNYPLYYLAFFDPTFAVMSGNPDTIPRTLVPIPSNAGVVKIYLRVRWIFSPNSVCYSILANSPSESEPPEQPLQRPDWLQLRELHQHLDSQVCRLSVILVQSTRNSLLL